MNRTESRISIKTLVYASLSIRPITYSLFIQKYYHPHNSFHAHPTLPHQQDTFFGFASLSTDAGKLLPRLTCVDLSSVSSGSIKNSNSTSAGLVSMRAFPAHKTLLK